MRPLRLPWWCNFHKHDFCGDFCTLKAEVDTQCWGESRWWIWQPPHCCLPQILQIWFQGSVTAQLTQEASGKCAWSGEEASLLPGWVSRAAGHQSCPGQSDLPSLPKPWFHKVLKDQKPWSCLRVVKNLQAFFLLTRLLKKQKKIPFNAQYC